ncbi:MAG: hypothetical protein ACJ8D6_09205 [Sphingomicrobium sp.]
MRSRGELSKDRHGLRGAAGIGLLSIDRRTLGARFTIATCPRAIADDHSDLADHAWRFWRNVAVRDLADHAPVNYISGVLGRRA